MKTDNDVGGVTSQAIQENSLKRKCIRCPKRSDAFLIWLFCHSPIEIALDADFFVTKQLL
ncbi:hypothetical protein DWY59_06730 [Ruminococcus bromii]|nr:hypothetical protein DWY59_06730 [Ruminococcus bromii]